MPFPKATFFLPLLLLLGLQSPAQHDTSRLSLGLGLTQVVSGLPEVMADYFFSGYLGASLHAGYTSRPLRGYIKVGDGVDLRELSGPYFKAGLKFRLWTKRPYATPFVQVLYIASFYTEKAFVRQHDLATVPAGREVTNSGFVGGPALATGADLRLGKRFAARLGLQFGYYRRSDHLGHPALTYQPGFGAEFILYNQLIAGLVCKFP